MHIIAANEVSILTIYYAIVRTVYARAVTVLRNIPYFHCYTVATDVGMCTCMCMMG